MIARISTRDHNIGVLEETGAVWLGRAYAGQKGHILRNPHKVATSDTDFCKARHHCKFDPCLTCAPCDDGLHLHTLDESLRLYEAHMREHPSLILEGLRVQHSGLLGACSCPLDARCHIDVLSDLLDISKRLAAVQGRPSRKTIRTSAGGAA